MEHCPHCYSTAEPIRCAECTRQMCKDCISSDEYGREICGACKDKEEKRKKQG